MHSESGIKFEADFDYISNVVNTGLYISCQSSPSDYDHMAEMAVPAPRDPSPSSLCISSPSCTDDDDDVNCVTTPILHADSTIYENSYHRNTVLFGDKQITNAYSDTQEISQTDISGPGSTQTSTTLSSVQMSLSQFSQPQLYKYETLSHVLKTSSLVQQHQRQRTTRKVPSIIAPRTPERTRSAPNYIHAFFRREHNGNVGFPTATISSLRPLGFLRKPHQRTGEILVPHAKGVRIDSSKHLTQRATSLMEGWYCANKDSPYPSKREKEIIANAGGITTDQVNSWFANRRNRSHNTRPKKNMKYLHNGIVNLCNEYEEISCGMLNASNMCSRILDLVNYYFNCKT